jgi:hypothetical protein
MGERLPLGSAEGTLNVRIGALRRKLPVVVIRPNVRRSTHWLAIPIRAIPSCAYWQMAAKGRQRS